MPHWILDLLALTTSLTSLTFIVRMKKTYFLDSRFFMATANAGFIIILTQGLAADITHLPGSQSLDVTMLSLMATTIGFSSYLLGTTPAKPGIQKLTRLISHPPKAFVTYTLIVAIWTANAIAFQPWTLHQTPGQEGPVYYYSFETWYIVLGAALVAAFIVFPVLFLYKQSQHLSDRKASSSTKIIGLSWALFGILAWVETAMSGESSGIVESIGNLTDSLLFMSISFALREPTILGRIMGTANITGQTIYSDSQADTIVLYKDESDRKKIIQNFVRQGLADGQYALCLVAKTEIPFYTGVLNDAGIPTKPNDENRIALQPIETTNGSGALLPPSFTKARRELVDLGDINPSEFHQIIEKMKELDKLPSSKRRGRIWALTAQSRHSGLLNLIRGTNPSARIIDLAGHQESFSELFRTDHLGLLGTTILLEYEPSSNYEDLVQKFAREFQANVEPVAVFTSVGSPVHRRLTRQPDIRLFSFTTKTSTPSKISDLEILLPERDTSLLLDAVDKLLEAHRGQALGIAFDVLTDLVLFLGFNKAYSVLSSMVDMTQSEAVTVVVLLNYAAVDERTLNAIRGQFRYQARYGRDGIRHVRLHSGEGRRRVNSEGQFFNTIKISREGVAQ